MSVLLARLIQIFFEFLLHIYLFLFSSRVCKPHELVGLLGHDTPLDGEKRKKEKIPSIVANDWVLDLDAQYETEDNPGIGHCAGFTLCLLFVFLFGCRDLYFLFYFLFYFVIDFCVLFADKF